MHLPRHVFALSWLQQSGVHYAPRESQRGGPHQLRSVPQGDETMSDEPEVWVDHDYPPLKRQYEQCVDCGGTRTFQHHCDLIRRLKAFGRDCVEHGDMTPSGERALLSILAVSVLPYRKEH